MRGVREDEIVGKLSLNIPSLLLLPVPLLAFWESILEMFKTDAEKLDLYSGLLSEKMKNPLPETIDDSFCKDVNKIVFVGKSAGNFAAVQQAFGDVCEIFQNSMPFSNSEGGEIGPLGVHKGSAVHKAAEYHGILMSDTIAFGDGDNDRQMIECAGVGIAMGNASDALKAIADEVTTSFDDNGIYNGFRKLGLI